MDITEPFSIPQGSDQKIEINIRTKHEEDKRSTGSNVKHAIDQRQLYRLKDSRFLWCDQVLAVLVVSPCKYTTIACKTNFFHIKKQYAVFCGYV